jgi:DNA-binding CsgD family transcriptional regulator
MATTLREVPMAPGGGRSTGLSEGERRALELSARGLTVPEVAAAMGASSDAVHAWLASAIAKLGARSKVEAVIIAARRGDLDLPP